MNNVEGTTGAGPGPNKVVVYNNLFIIYMKHLSVSKINHHCIRDYGMSNSHILSQLCGFNFQLKIFWLNLLYVATSNVVRSVCGKFLFHCSFGIVKCVSIS